MDIKAKINEIVDKVKSDKNFAEKFTKDPTAAVEELLGVKLPKDEIESVVSAVKAKVNLDDIGGKLGALGGLLKK